MDCQGQPAENVKQMFVDIGIVAEKSPMNRADE